MLRRVLPIILALSVVATACGGGDDDASAEGALTGLLRIEAGKCDGDGAPSGSYFRMVQPGGTPAEGPFVENGDSPCKDTTFTPLAPGSDGGLRIGAHQPAPNPAFDGGGHALSSAIVKPTAWFSVKFGVSTNQTDPQTMVGVPAPSIEVAEGEIVGGDMSAVAASWNEQHFNQGSPKPGGQKPGNTTGPTGIYDADSGEMLLEWTSEIEGGPFHSFTGVWFLEGTFEPDET